MKTLNLGVVIDQGADFSLIIGVFGDDGQPLDITGYQFKSQMRKSTAVSATPIAEFSFAIQNQTTNKGQVKWSLPLATIDMIVTTIATAQENTRPTTPFVFDIKMKDTAGRITRPVQGLILVSPQATEEAFT